MQGSFAFNITNQGANQDTLSFDMSIFENGPVCIFRWDGVTNDEGVHPARSVTKNVGALLGYNQEDLLARTVEYGNLVDAPDIARVLANIIVKPGEAPLTVINDILDFSKIDAGDMERCLNGGMDDYLSKPISPSRLTEKLEKWLGAGHASTLALA